MVSLYYHTFISLSPHCTIADPEHAEADGKDDDRRFLKIADRDDDENKEHQFIYNMTFWNDKKCGAGRLRLCTKAGAFI